jgi:YNFM family putative membrane transporter
VTLALFSAGLATFALLYCIQPILPLLSDEFHVSPAGSSLSLSISTGMLALGLLFTGPLSDAIGRKKVMVSALLLASCCTLLSTLMSSWHGILIMRALIGLSLSGIFSDFFNWRVAVAVMGCFALASALMFWRILPESRHFRPIKLRPKSLLINFHLHLRDSGLPLLFIEGFLLMGSFVTLFNYIGYRLMSSPWGLSQAMVGLLSLVYLTGVWSSPKAGLMTEKYGRGPVLIAATLIMGFGLALTLSSVLVIIFIGMTLFSGGFFAAHSVASSWIGTRARRAKGQASSLYLFCYYLGSSVAGTLGGIFWHQYGWAGIAGFIGLLLSGAVAIGFRLHCRTH